MTPTIREKVAGLIVARLGSNMTPPRTAEEDAAEVAALLDRHPVGGLILFNGRWPETRQTLRDLQSRSQRDLLVMTDMERGLGQQVEGTTRFPHLMAFGALGDGAEEAVRDFARHGAREALALRGTRCAGTRGRCKPQSAQSDHLDSRVRYRDGDGRSASPGIYRRSPRSWPLDDG